MNKNSLGKNAKRADLAFALVMLAFPLVHFAVFYLYTNVNAWAMSFKINTGGKEIWSLNNYVSFFETLFTTKGSEFGYMMLNTLYLFVAGDFVALPLAVFFSYVFFKKIAMAGFFRVVFYLPSVVSLVALTLVFRWFVTVKGPLNEIFTSNYPDFFGSPDYAVHTIMFFNVWSGMGYSIILISGVMARLPQEVFESLKLDGCGAGKEFVKVVVPLCSPIISTLFVLNLANAFTNFASFMLFTPDNYKVLHTDVIGYYVYRSATSVFAANQGTAAGIILSVVALPIIFVTKHFTDKKAEDVTF